ncbi:MAG: SGNH/GDSL hydrolase family protein [Clostridiales bacterium]|nr:SGNH/GDSL hydrolase family protein [Clostridiales bacterium]
MGMITAFGDSVLKGVIYEDDHYRVTDASFQKICEESFGITIENFTATYRSIINEIKDLGKTPVLLSMPPIDSARYFKQISKGLCAENIMKWMRNDSQYITNWHERYNIEIFKLAISTQVPVIDITSIFLEKKNYSRFLCEDGIHPNEEGHKLIATAIEEHVRRRRIVL